MKEFKTKAVDFYSFDVNALKASWLSFGEVLAVSSQGVTASSSDIDWIFCLMSLEQHYRTVVSYMKASV
jgi:hypothetical protein